MRGGDRYPVLVRKTEPKPIRIFMVDGSHDEWMGGPEVGDWWMSNQTMERALEFAGYQVNHIWGEETHDDRHATAVFPDAMRWLWKDWPNPVVAGQSQNLFLQSILEPGQGWEAIPGDYKSDGSLTADPAGAIIFRDTTDGKTYKLLPDEHPHEIVTIGTPYLAMVFDAEGRTYLSEKGCIVMLGSGGVPIKVAGGLNAGQFIVTHARQIYATETGTKDSTGKVWLVQPGGRKTLLDSGLDHPSAITLSPDGLWLAVAENKSHWGFSYRVEPNGTVRDRQRFYWFHVPDDAEDSGVSARVMDQDGRLHAATRMGVQVFDRNGRVRAILPLPYGQVTGLAFGGAEFHTLYATCTDHKVYSRRMRVAGSPVWPAPIKLPGWGPG